MQIYFINHEYIILLIVNLILIKFFSLEHIFDTFIIIIPLVIIFIYFKVKEMAISFNQYVKIFSKYFELTIQMLIFAMSLEYC